MLAVAVDAADGTAERRCAKAMLKQVRHRHRLRPKTVGMDTGFDDGEFLAEVEVPLLIIHAADDPICPPSEMDDLIEIAEDNPNVQVWMMPAGNHCLFQYMDRNWYLTVMRNFFSYWADWGQADQGA